VPPAELEDLKDAITARFEALSGPDGDPITDRVHRSEDVFHGDALDGAPDLMPVLRDHRFELDDELFFRRPFTDQRHLPRGVHHPEGIVVVSGPGVQISRDLTGSVMDVTPTLLHMAGLQVPEGLDGSVLTDAFTAGALESRPISSAGALSSRATEESSPYSQEEEAAIEESLRGLGYL